MENANRKRAMGIVAAACGVLSALFYLLHDLVGGAYYPGYDRMAQAVSDLTATDAPSFAVASGLSAVYGIFACLCCAFLCFLVAGQNKPTRLGAYLFAAMQGVSAVGYSLFPLSGSGYDGSARSFVHVYIVTVAVVLLSIASLVLLAVGGVRAKRRALAVAALVSLCCMCFGSVGGGALPASAFGLVERFSTYAAVLFTAFFGIWGLFVSAKSDEEKEG